MPSTTIKYFAFAHLPPHLQAISKPVGLLAEKLEALLVDGPEKSAGMRKLLEAKDCFVRTALDMPQSMLLTPDAPPSHQQRVVDERDELDDRLRKLNGFFTTAQFSALPDAEQRRMRDQALAMRTYSDILDERIEAFPA